MEKTVPKMVVKILCVSLLSLLLVGLMNVEAASPPQVIWLDQFGTSSRDQACRVAVYGPAVYVYGVTEGAFPSQTNQGGVDAFICKYDVYGNLKWIRQFGTSGDDQAYGLAVYGSAVYVVGYTEGAFPGQINKGDKDAFICKYDACGNLKWIRQFGTSGTDDAYGVSVSWSGVYVAGLTLGALPGQTNKGLGDAYVRKYDACGNVKWTRQFGTSGNDGEALPAVYGSAVYVAGVTDSAFPGKTNAGAFDAFVRKYDIWGNLKWTRQIGSSGSDHTLGASVDCSGVYVVGFSWGALPGQTYEGIDDAFVFKYDAYGNLKWTRQFGTSGSDMATDVAVYGSAVYVAGFTDGALPSQTNQGLLDAFVRKYDACGNFKWTLQFGTSDNDGASGVSVSCSGVYIAGFTRGVFPGQNNEGFVDAFVCKYAPP